MHASTKRATRKTKIGVVMSDKMDKTITVRMERITYHPIYKKMMRRATTVKAHDEKEAAGIGDTVRIQETRPLSKTKCWRLVEIITRAPEAPTHEKPAKAASQETTS